MSDIANGNSQSAEYYFEYKIERVSGNAEKVKTPKLYFERDTKTKELIYALFAVPYEWLMKSDNTQKRHRPKPEYTEVRVAFDINGVNCNNLSAHSANIKLKNTISFEEFYRMGCRVNIENNGSHELSGVGSIEMLNNGVVISKFLFSVNFVFKRKISYELDVRGGQLSIQFECKDRPVKVPVRVVYSHGRLPCLKNDMNVNVICDKELVFSGKDKCRLVENLPSSALREQGNIFSVTIPDEKISRFYLLNCKSNNTIHIRTSENIGGSVSYTCPFCHKTIDKKMSENPYYKNGGIGCQEANVKLGEKKSPTIYTKQGIRSKKCLYCSEEISEIGLFKPGFERLLPERFMEHDNFKIAMAGSKRSGKTTYISRFFDMVGNDSVSMNMSAIQNCISGFGINVHSASIPGLTPPQGDQSYQITSVDWQSDNQIYRDRAISLDPPKFVGETSKSDLTPYPFVVEVNEKSYFSIYDIAGEDAEGSRQVRDLANGGTIGIFFIVNSVTDVANNNKVANMLKDTNIPRNSPIAIIYTKMDMLEKDFDPNCFCLRTDYFDKTKKYKNSLQHHIDQSSEEIKSVLIQRGLWPNLDNPDGNREGFRNIKCFGVSAFNFFDSIHDVGDSPNDPGNVNFECSSKRMELPFIWMLKQFGVIQ